MVSWEASKRRRCGRESRVSGKASTEPGLLGKETKGIICSEFGDVESVRIFFRPFFLGSGG